MLELDKAFKDSRTMYFINDKEESKSILFNPSQEDLGRHLKDNRQVNPDEWEAYVTKGMRK